MATSPRKTLQVPQETWVEYVNFMEHLGMDVEKPGQGLKLLLALFWAHENVIAAAVPDAE